MSCKFVNCRFAPDSPDADSNRSIACDEGLIVALDQDAVALDTDATIDIDGGLVIPGLIDCYARLREPGFEKAATIYSEITAAARAGITTLMCAPDTDPVTDEPAIVEQILQRASAVQGARVMPIGALTSGLQGDQLSEMFTLQEAGCIAFSNGDKYIKDAQVLRRAMEYASGFDLKVIIAPQDPWLSVGVAHQGAVATRLGLAGIPTAAETVALSQLIELSYQTGAPVHFSRLSSRRGVWLVEQAKRDGISVTADTGIHHLFLSEFDIAGFDAMYHTSPPFRTRDDLDALRAGLASGTIDAICSNHAPHETDAKLTPFPDSQPGTSALDAVLPLLIKLHRDMQVPLATILERMSGGPARCFGLDQGTLATGRPADFCVIDTDCEWEFSPQDIHSAGKNHPCTGWWMQGQVERTVVAGTTVYNARSDP